MAIIFILLSAISVALTKEELLAFSSNLAFFFFASSTIILFIRYIRTVAKKDDY